MRDERDAFERMVRTHHDAVLAYALRRIDPHDAKDVVADTFLVAWRRFSQAPDGAQLPWLYGIARKTLANHRRAARRRTALADRLSLSSAQPAEGDGDLSGALAALPNRDREALLLVAWEGLSLEEAALVFACSTATFRMRLHRARRRLAALLDESNVMLSASLERHL